MWSILVISVYQTYSYDEEYEYYKTLVQVSNPSYEDYFYFPVKPVISKLVISQHNYTQYQIIRKEKILNDTNKDIQETKKNLVIEIQNIINKIGVEFPDNSIILISFFDENGVDIPDMFFVIDGGRVVRSVTDDYELYLSIPISYLEELIESSNPCILLNNLKKENNYKFEKKIGFLESLKYLSFSKCILL